MSCDAQDLHGAHVLGVDDEEALRAAEDAVDVVERVLWRCPRRTAHGGKPLAALSLRRAGNAERPENQATLTAITALTTLLSTQQQLGRACIGAQGSVDLQGSAPRRDAASPCAARSPCRHRSSTCAAAPRPHDPRRTVPQPAHAAAPASLRPIRPTRRSERARPGRLLLRPAAAGRRVAP